MIITRTPYRISLFGGGSDYPAWYRAHGGTVLGMAINKYCYISLRALPPFFSHRHRIVYSSIELVQKVEEIRHPAVRHVLMEHPVDFGIEVHHDGDVPARSGLGSSSSFTVGLLNALYARCGRMVSKQELSREAIRIEQEVMREHVGSQDQVWATYGGFNRIDFRPEGAFDVTPVVVSEARRHALLGSLLLVFTGLSRYADEIAAKKIANLQSRSQHIRRMVEMVDEGLAILHDERRPLSEIGEMLHESWLLKRELADCVSSPDVDDIYEAARSAGAIGGKLLGAGGGGFMLFYVEPERRAAVCERLKVLTQVDFSIDYSGSRVVVYEPDGLENR